MAVKPWRALVTPFDGGGFKLVVWEGLADGDTGAPFVCAAYPDKTVQFLGTFGGAVTLEGTMNLDLEAAVYATLNDPQGLPCSGVTSARVKNILEHVYALRPVAGAGVADVDVWLALATGGR